MLMGAFGQVDDLTVFITKSVGVFVKKHPQKVKNFLWMFLIKKHPQRTNNFVGVFLPLFLFFSEGVVLPHFFSPGLFCLVFSFLFFLVCFCFPEFVFCLIFSGSIHSLMLT